MSNILLSDIIQATASAALISIPQIVTGAEASIVTNATSASDNYIEYHFIVPQSPMGRDLREVLFADSEFKNFYHTFSKELESDLDKQFQNNKISVMQYYRMKRKMTQHQLANTINEKQPHICRWEGKKNLYRVPAETVEKIAKALSITVEELLHGPGR